MSPFAFVARVITTVTILGLAASLDLLLVETATRHGARISEIFLAATCGLAVTAGLLGAAIVIALWD